MRLDKLILKNFLTFEYLEYDFENRPLLIQGLNLTDSGQKSNGSGKSGMQTGIEFCITASNSRDVRDMELVSFGYDQAKAGLYASCDQRKETIHIDWTIKVKGSNLLSIKTKQYGAEDWVDVNFSNINDGKKYISSWFAIEKEDLFNYYIINKTRFKSFFKSSNKEKVDLINRFSDASIVEGLEDVDNTKFQSTYDEQKSSIIKIEGKLELIEESILKEKLKDYKALLKEESEEIDEEIEDLEIEIEELGKSTLKKEGQIKDLKKSIKKTKIEKLEIGRRAEKIHDQISTQNETLQKADKELDKAQKALEDFIDTDWESKRIVHNIAIDETEDGIEVLDEEVDVLDQKSTKLLKFLKGIEISLSGLITCPSCNHKFTLENNESEEEIKEKQNKGLELQRIVEKKQEKLRITLKGLESTMEEHQLHIAGLNKEERVEQGQKNELAVEVNKINSNINLIRDNISKLKNDLSDNKEDQRDCDNEVKEIGVQIKEIEGDIRNTANKVINIKEEIAQYRQKKLGLKVGNGKEIIKGLEFEKSILNKDMQAKNIELLKTGDQIYQRNQWAANFKQFRMYLANQSLETIEFHCNRYLSNMGSDLTVKMEGYKMLANGTIKDEITAKIIRNVERSFSSFSGGEQGRLLFASILANRHMINQTHPYGGFDFLSVDEVFEGVDSIGLKFLIQSAKQLEIAVMIITHVTDEDVSDDILLITKENGVSIIKSK